MTNISISSQMMDFVFDTMEEAVTMLKHQGELRPFAIFITKQGRVLRRFVASDNTSTIDKARQAVTAESSELIAYAIVYEAVITVNEQESDAIMIECGEQGHHEGYYFARRYQPATAQIPLYPIGDIAYMGKATQHLHALPPE